MTTIAEAYQRLLPYGPEYDAGMSDHAPMAVEAMVRRGHDDAVDSWLDGYVRRLDHAPVATGRISSATWRDALGDRRRVADWIAWFSNELDEHPWEDVLAQWWPRLLPGITGGATHGVIRTGHAVVTLREHGSAPEAIVELATALGYWAACWRLTAGESASWHHRAPAAARADLQHLVERTVRDFVALGGHRTIMLVHTSTAPNAVLRTLPSLPDELWPAATAAAGAAVAVLQATYGGPQHRPASHRGSAEDLFARAVDHGDEHVIKFCDTVLDVHTWTRDDDVLSSGALAADLIAQP